MATAGMFFSLTEATNGFIFNKPSLSENSVCFLRCTNFGCMVDRLLGGLGYHTVRDPRRHPGLVSTKCELNPGSPELLKIPDQGCYASKPGMTVNLNFVEELNHHFTDGFCVELIVDIFHVLFNRSIRTINFFCHEFARIALQTVGQTQGLRFRYLRVVH